MTIASDVIRVDAVPAAAKPTRDRESDMVAAIVAVAMILGYEQHVRPVFSPHINILALGVLFLHGVRRGVKIDPRRMLPVCIFACAFAWSLLSIVAKAIDPETDVFVGEVAKTVAQMGVVAGVACLAPPRTLQRSLELLTSAAIPLAIVAVLQETNTLRALYPSKAFRATSVFHDPNYASVYFGAAFMMSLIFVRNAKLRLAIIVSCLIGLYLTFSKGGAITLAVGFGAYAALRLDWPSRLLAIGAASGVTLLGGAYFGVIQSVAARFRFNMGLNQRDKYWLEAVESVRERLWFGHDIEQSKKISTIFDHAHNSIHNYYIEQALFYGLPYTFIVILLIVISLWRSRLSPTWFGFATFMAVGANAFTYSIGSVGLLPYLFTVAFLAPFMAGWRLDQGRPIRTGGLVERGEKRRV